MQYETHYFMRNSNSATPLMKDMKVGLLNDAQLKPLEVAISPRGLY
jgi:hypothetical protein